MASKLRTDPVIAQTVFLSWTGFLRRIFLDPAFLKRCYYGSKGMIHPRPRFFTWQGKGGEGWYSVVGWIWAIDDPIGFKYSIRCRKRGSGFLVYRHFFRYYSMRDGQEGDGFLLFGYFKYKNSKHGKITGKKL